MARRWPPPPSVEDEEVALASEHGAAKSDDQPAGSRGTVDQYPIILDVNHRELTSDDTSGLSSDESLGPPTPTLSRTENRFVHIPTPETKPTTTTRNTPPLQSSKQETFRGRPSVARIQTDLGEDLQEAITGRRRAPSPYAYAPAQKSEKTEHGNRFSGEFLLSPEHARLPIIDTKRASSARPRIRTEDLDSSTDSDRRPDRRRHHSRKRSTKESFARPPQLTPDTPQRPAVVDTRAASYSGALPDPGLLYKGLHKEGNGVVAREQLGEKSRRTSKESPNASSAEESRARSKYQYFDDRSSQNSPYTSSAEESKGKRSDHENGSFRPRRSSMRRRERPHLDLQSHHYSYGGGEIPDDKHESDSRQKEPKHHSVYDGRNYLGPSSLRSPKATEDYLEQALKGPRTRSSGVTPRPSPLASPQTSPPSTPPRTSRADRRSKDYFSLGASVPASVPVQKSRPLSREEGFFAEMKPLTAAIAAAGIGKLAAGLPPNLSRSSTSSLEQHSGGPASRTSSGRRSRNPSPTREEMRPISRTGSFAQSDIRPVLRAPTFPMPDGRPMMRTGSYVPPQEASPRLTHRASSYSSADDHPYQRSPQSPRASQHNFLPVTVTESVVSAGPRPTRPSASSADKVPVLPQASVATRPLPPCPYPDQPVARGARLMGQQARWMVIDYTVCGEQLQTGNRGAPACTLDIRAGER